MSRRVRDNNRQGIVYIVGAGPGAPELLTVRARELVRRADVILYDRLVSPMTLLLARPGAELVDVGKRKGDPDQERINALLVKHARAGKTVVRLKGGDPGLFARSGEEIEALVNARVAWEIVPGVSAVNAVSAAAALPLTWRGQARTVGITTAATANGTPSRLPATDTVVVFMPVAQLAGLVAGALAAGWPPETPCLLAQAVFTPAERLVFCRLADLAATAEKVGVKPPALLVMGKAVGLRQDLFRALGTRLTLGTRRHASASDRLGVWLPAIAVAPPADLQAVDAAARRVNEYTWVVFTSRWGAHVFLTRLCAVADLRTMAPVKIAAIGPETAHTLGEWGLRPDLVPQAPDANSLARAIAGQLRGGERILWPTSSRAGTYLQEVLGEAGAVVDRLEAYRTVLEPLPPVTLEPGDEVVFTSPSTVEAFFASGNTLIEGVVARCLGPATAAAIRRYAPRTEVVVDVPSA